MMSSQPLIRLILVLALEAAWSAFHSSPSLADPTPVPSPEASPLQKVAVSSAGSQENNQGVMNRVSRLVNDMNDLSVNLKQGLPEDQMKTTLQKIDKALNNAQELMAPERGTGAITERILAKVQDAMEQLQDAMTRVAQGQGSVGMLLKDPELMGDLKGLMEKTKALLSARHELRFVMDLGIQEIGAYPLSHSRSYVNIGIWPRTDHYYLLGFAVDPRGSLAVTNTTTVAANGSSTTTQQTQVNQTGFVITGMVGSLFFDRQLDLSIGALYGDLAVTAIGNFGAEEFRERYRLRLDIYSHGIGAPSDMRFYGTVEPIRPVYWMGGIDGYRTVYGKLPWFYGIGMAFDDQDIRTLFGLYHAIAF